MSVHDEFPKSTKNNAAKPVPERRQANRTVTNPVKVKNSNTFSKILRGFVKKDVTDIGNYLIYDVAIPTIENGILNSLSMMFFGNAYYGGTTTSSTPTNYAAQYKGPEAVQNAASNIPQSKPSYQNIAVVTEDEARATLSELRALIGEYGRAYVADLYQCVGWTPDVTDWSYGWYNLETADYIRVPAGFLLRLPKAVQV